jgi:hypothetical protein
LDGEQVPEMKARLTSATDEKTGRLNGLAEALFSETVADLPQMPEKQRIKRPRQKASLT